jgi:hypothetical protein
MEYVYPLTVLSLLSLLLLANGKNDELNETCARVTLSTFFREHLSHG